MGRLGRRDPRFAIAPFDADRLLVVVDGHVESPRFAVDGTTVRSRGILLAGSSLALLSTTKRRGELSIVEGSRRRRLGRLERALLPLEDVARAKLAHLSAYDRARVADFVGRASARLSPTAMQVNRMLRERLPFSTGDPVSPLAVAPEVLLDLGHGSFYLRGWATSRLAKLERLSIVSPTGSRSELAATAARLARADIAGLSPAAAALERRDPSGFVATFSLPGDLGARGWTVELVDERGEGVEAEPMRYETDSETVRNLVLGDLRLAPPGDETLLAQHAHPAIRHLQDRVASSASVARVKTFGREVGDPAVTLVVPLYARIDLLRHQMAQFAHDREFAEVDLVYVLDSPELEDELVREAADVWDLYRLPFRVVVLSHSCGVARARNVGASLARAEVIAFADSDVLPAEPGWLSRLAGLALGNPEVGAVAPKLIYEDGTVQHAGLSFREDAQHLLWRIEHRLRGIHRDTPAANRDAPVDAVTGSCLVLRRGLFEEVGGFDVSYTVGGYEDADLCLRLRELGAQNWCLPAIELYHLEGQSYNAELRQLTWRYNAWTISRRWTEFLRSKHSAEESFVAASQLEGLLDA